MKLLKKAQVGGLQGFILSIVTVAIVLAIGLIVMNELRTTAKEMDTTSALNETVAHNAAVNLGGELFKGASACRNLSDQDPWDLGVTCNVSSVGFVTVANGTTDASVDYSYYTPSAAYNSSNKLIVKLATVPNWLGIIIIVALAFIVLSFFIGKRQ